MIFLKKIFTCICVFILFIGCTDAGIQNEQSLHKAIDALDQAQVVKAVEGGADLNKIDDYSYTPLIAAATLNQWEMVHYLLENGADYEITDNWDKTIVFSIEKNNIDPISDGYKWRSKVIDFLSQRGVSVNPYEPFKLDEPLVTNYETTGNLEAKQKFNCVEFSTITNANSPPEIYSAMYSCIQDDEYMKAIKFFKLASYYSVFDTKRVSDNTAHQAIIVLREKHIGGLEQFKLDKLLSAQSDLMGNDEISKFFCSKVRSIGHPTYHPTYMIQHGMGAILDDTDGNGLVEGFDAETAWNGALKNNCSLN